MNSWQKQSGFTLIELMVALGISLFLIGGAMAVMLNGSRSSTFNEQLANLQDSVRLSMHSMEQDIRMAGYMGCGLDIELKNVLGITDSLATGTQGIEGWTGTAWQPSNTTPATGSISIKATTDAITVRHIGGNRGIKLTAQLPSSKNSASMSLNIVPFKANEPLAITNCTKTDLFNFQSGATLNHPYNTGDVVSRMRFLRYYVADNNGEPHLFRQIVMNGGVSSQALFPGIEHMEIRYGEDVAPFNGRPDRYVAAENVTNWNQVTAVRIGILARSPINFDLPQDTSAHSMFGAQVLAAQNDRRIRRVFYNTIQLRNKTI